MKKAAKKTAAKELTTRSSKKKKQPEPVQAPVSRPKLSGDQIEKELARVHKVIAQAGAAFAIMLATRRMSIKRIEDAREKMSTALASCERLLSLLR